jgi:ATP synthase protein I
MSRPSENHGNKEMHHAVELREKRVEQGKKDGERSIWQNLSMVGALGWLIVTPILIGIWLGRWLDRMFHSGIFFSGALIFLGVVIGCYLAWQRIKKEQNR